MESEGRNGDPEPFSADELESYSGDWALSCDMRLLSNFKSLSSSMFEKADSLMTELNEVVYKAEEKSVKVSNVVNDLQMLATNQFIENRVYEEPEEAVAAIEPQTGTGGQQNAMSQIKSSLNRGIEFVAQELPLIEVEEDSDEEDNIRHAMHTCLRQNRFLHRKLPPLVGGHEFSRENFVSLFRLQNSLEVSTDAVDAGDAFMQNKIPDFSDDEEDERKSEPDIVISSSDSEDMFQPPEKKPSFPVSAATISKSANLFSDSSSPEVEDIFNAKPKPVSKPSNQLSFQDELNRRLLGSERAPQPANNSDLPSPSFKHSMTPNKQASEANADNAAGSGGSGSSVSRTDFRDRLGDLFAETSRLQAAPTSSAEPAIPSKGRSVPAPPQSQAIIPKTNAVPSFRKPLDFLSDDDDDEFSIFKTKLATKEKQPEKLSQLFESDNSSSDDQETQRRGGSRKGLPAKDSSSQRVPEKEVDDALHSDMRDAAKSATNAALELVNPTASLFSEETASSEDDLFTARVHLSSAQQTSINSSHKSQVSDVRDIQATSHPEGHSAGAEAKPFDGSESSTEEMDRSAIASKLEKTIFGSQTRKPVGGISMFGDTSSLAKKSLKAVGGSDPAKTIVKDSIKKLSAETSAPTSETQELKKKLPAKSSDDDIFSGGTQQQNITLSSQALKSRPKMRNKRRPTRAALKSPVNEPQDRSSPAEEVCSPVSASLGKQTDSSEPVGGTSVVVSEVMTPEVKEAGIIKSNANENSSAGKKAEQIPRSDTHQLKAGNLIKDSDSKDKKASDTSNNTNTSTSSKKAILSEDSDDDLFAAPLTSSTKHVVKGEKSRSAAVAVNTDAKKKALFSDSEDEDVFAATKSQNPSLAETSKTNHSAAGDRALFKKNDKLSVKTAPKVEKDTVVAKPVAAKPVEDKNKKQETKQSHLFSDDSDDDDLFTSKPK